MALPKVSTPTYELTVPSTGEKVSYRPFLVKEEKTLLMAAEDQNISTITKAMRDIISTCTEGEVDLKNLAPYDIEYIFLQLRGKSVGDVITLNLKKPESIECEESECPGSTEVKIDIDGQTVTGGSDYMLMKFNHSGVKQWTKLKGTSNYDQSYGLTIDSSNNLYTFGGYDGELYSGPHK